MQPDLIARPTAMALAFIDAAARATASRKGRQSVAKAAARESGLVMDRAVNAKVSFRTAEKLKKKGVL